MNDFCVFILTHGRPGNVKTYKTLRNGGYTGPIFLVVDDEDKMLEKYRENFGEQIVVFSKDSVAGTFDAGTNSGDKRSVVFARNACWNIAEDLGFKYFVQLDDDYTRFFYTVNDRLERDWKKVQNLDRVFEAALDFYKSAPSLVSIAFAQGGDLMSRHVANFITSKGLRRKAMNSFFCSTERPFKFVGILNDDVNTYVTGGARGEVFLTMSQVALIQAATQQSAGGLTDLYLDSGTYVKSFYTVMMAPSSVVVSAFGPSNPRLHHRIAWRNTVPRLIREAHRKS